MRDTARAMLDVGGERRSYHAESPRGNEIRPTRSLVVVPAFVVSSGFATRDLIDAKALLGDLGS